MAVSPLAHLPLQVGSGAHGAGSGLPGSVQIIGAPSLWEGERGKRWLVKTIVNRPRYMVSVSPGVVVKTVPQREIGRTSTRRYLDIYYRQSMVYRLHHLQNLFLLDSDLTWSKQLPQPHDVTPDYSTEHAEDTYTNTAQLTPLQRTEQTVVVVAVFDSTSHAVAYISC